MFASCKRSKHPSILRQLDPDVLALAVGFVGSGHRLKTDLVALGVDEGREKPKPLPMPIFGTPMEPPGTSSRRSSQNGS
ncbi:MAG: hypothetical protein IPP21_19110 [Betaproteobacteria bacterium]|nr:hypothetical protein [Betaproteobacteria bacterium]